MPASSFPTCQSSRDFGNNMMAWLILILLLAFPSNQLEQTISITETPFPRTASGEIISLMDLAWSPDGGEIAVASTIGVWLYRINEPEKQPHLFTYEDERALVIAFSPNGNLLAAGFDDGAVIVWDLKTNTQIARLKDTVQLITMLAFSSDGTKLLAGTAFGQIHLWDVSNSNHIDHEIVIVTDDDWFLNINLDWTKGVSTPSNTMKSIILWRLDNDLAKVIEVKEFEAHTDIVVGVEFNDVHNLLASFSYYTDNGVRLWSGQTGEMLASIDVWTESIQFNPDGNLLATDAVDHLIKIWSVDKALEEKFLESGDEWLILRGHTNDVERIAFSPDGEFLASASYDWTLRIWNLETGLEQIIISLSALLD
jgi:hypothetical protein